MDEQIITQDTDKKNIQWNRVTWYSQTLAIVLALIIFSLGYYIGKLDRSLQNSDVLPETVTVQERQVQKLTEPIASEKVQEKSRVIASASFEAPYPVVWQDRDRTPNFGGSGKFSLTGATLEEVVIDEELLKTFWNGFDYGGYVAGQKITVVGLNLKLNVINGGTLPSNIRRIKLDSAGGEDKIPPMNRDYLYENHKPMNDFVTSDSTINDARVIFLVNGEDIEFLFTTGLTSQPNSNFKLIKADAGNLTLELNDKESGVASSSRQF